MGVTLTRVWLCAKYALPYLRDSETASIINAGSTSSLSGYPQCQAYGASKGAVMQLTKMLAVDLAPDGIRVNCYCPGSIHTQIVDKFLIELNDQMAGKKIYINISDAVRNWLAREGYDPNYGARPLARVIQKKIKDRLADEILFGKLVKGGVVFVDRQNEELTFKME